MATQGFPYTTWPTDDVIVQEGTFAYDFIASGTIYAGQGVEPVGTMQVRKVKTTYKQIGVAAYDVTTEGQHIAVYGPGNIVRVCASGTTCAVNKVHGCNIEGKWAPYDTLGGSPNNYVSGTRAIGLESQATADGSFRVILL